MSVPINNAKSKDNPFEFFLYDTSGEHGLPVNLNRKNHNGINKLRLNWINDRNDTTKAENGSLIANKQIMFRRCIMQKKELLPKKCSLYLKEKIVI